MHRVIAFLEDRRVLYAPDELEVPSHCVHSVLEIRHFLSGELGKPVKPFLANSKADLAELFQTVECRANIRRAQVEPGEQR